MFDLFVWQQTIIMSSTIGWLLRQELVVELTTLHAQQIARLRGEVAELRGPLKVVAKPAAKAVLPNR